MQNAKDTMYETMRARLATVNPDRTVVLRGATRVALVVAENEVAAMTLPMDCFALTWGAVKVNAESALPLVAMEASVRYRTAGNAANAGTDRGRALAAMDAELRQVVNASPQRAVKTEYSGASAAAVDTSIWWSDLSYGPATEKNGVLERVATFTAMAYEEDGGR